MYSYPEDIEHGQLLSTDLCIIGGGAAGITVAQAMIGAKFKVLLVESGDLKPDPNIQKLYEGENVGYDYDLSSSRLRYFGGSTNHWSGWCIPLLPSDFKKRDWVPYSGWPLTFEELLPYYEKAQAVCDLGAFDYRAEPFLDQETARLFSNEAAILETPMYQYYSATRFGKKYHATLEQSSNVQVLLRTNLVSFLHDDEPGKLEYKIIAIDCQTLEGKRFRIAANRFILATGGIENARLLLASRDAHGIGLGNRQDLVGRFFMEHPHTLWEKVYLGITDLSLSWDSFDRFVRWKFWTQQTRVAFALSESTKQQERILAAAATLNPIDGNETETLSQDDMSILGSLSRMDEKLWPRATRRYRQDIQSSFRQIFLRSEQQPNPDSRVMLSAKKDRLGLPLVKLDWQLTELDYHSMQRTIELMGKALALAGIGRVRFLSTKSSMRDYKINGGCHHIGTTRMATNPKEGVTDANAKVFGITNLYIAGSSLFSTAGYANPTLTIVALSLRLAEFIRRNLD